MEECDLFATNDENETVFSLACENGSIEIMEHLFNTICERHGDEKGMEVLNTPDEYEQTLLFLSSEKGDVPTVRWLMKHEGIDLKACNECGDTPLHAAAQACSLEVMSAILDAPWVPKSNKKGYISAINKDGETCLDIAEMAEHFEMVEVSFLLYIVLSTPLPNEKNIYSK